MKIGICLQIGQLDIRVSLSCGWGDLISILGPGKEKQILIEQDMRREE
jgi:hypothetical protein